MAQRCNRFGRPTTSDIEFCVERELWLFRRGEKLAQEFGEGLDWGIANAIRFNPEIKAWLGYLPVADVVTAYQAVKARRAKALSKAA